MRKPTPNAYEWHANRLSGREDGWPITHEPQCGFFKQRLVRGGPWVGVHIGYSFLTDENGELVSDEVLTCTVDGKPADPEQVWTYVAKRPISSEEYRFLMNLSAYAKARDPDEPLAQPRKPINDLTTPIPVLKRKRRTNK
jgi:hypothetical protein